MGCERGGVELVDNAQNVAFLHDEQIFAINLDLCPGPFAEQHSVAGLDVQRDELAAFVARAWANRDNLTFLWLFLCGIWNDDAAFGLFLAFETLDDHAVVQGTKRHCNLFLFCAEDSLLPTRQRDKRTLLALSFDECYQRAGSRVRSVDCQGVRGYEAERRCGILALRPVPNRR